jgi:hypothetical protein
LDEIIDKIEIENLDRIEEEVEDQKEPVKEE